jgi:hypothetical protein
MLFVGHYHCFLVPFISLLFEMAMAMAAGHCNPLSASTPMAMGGHCHFHFQLGLPFISLLFAMAKVCHCHLPTSIS